MIILEQRDSHICVRFENELLRIEAWGTDSLRIRSTQCSKFEEDDKALTFVAPNAPLIEIGEDSTKIINGKIECRLDNDGVMSFYKGDKLLLKEYYRDLRYEHTTGHGSAINVTARVFKPQIGGDYETLLNFESDDNEKIFGMGQYQQPNLNVKGCILELAQRNSQISIPFCLSNKGYGFLWNNPGVGEAVFAKNRTTWKAESAKEIDYWITCGDTPAEIIKNYTEVTGRAPHFPENALGLWQSKLRYRTQEELLEVAREYKKRNIPLDVIVVDYFHWVLQGEWEFDSKYWPDLKAMTDELNDLGVRCMVSVWPTVDKKSSNYEEMKNRGLLVRSDRGANQCMDFCGDIVFYDAMNPEARKFLWKKLENNYCKNGINMFWLDASEPEFSTYDFGNYRYYNGSALKVGNQYPKLHTMGVYEGLKSIGKDDIVTLVRSAWVGSQKYAALVWSGDIKSNFTALRDQLSAGLNIGIAGIPWWTTDTGGFSGDVTSDGFAELMIRWFQFSVFSPVLRMHGDRGPHDVPAISDDESGGGFYFTGRDNELWSFGDEAYEIMKKYLDIRLSMKDYIASLMDEASYNGSPLIRTMFYEFPEDEKCWQLDDQYMFGSKYLVAPVLYQGMKERKVYLPDGMWRCIHSGNVYNGKQEITVKTPLDIIPVFESCEN